MEPCLMWGSTMSKDSHWRLKVRISTFALSSLELYQRSARECRIEKALYSLRYPKHADTSRLLETLDMPPSQASEKGIYNYNFFLSIWWMAGLGHSSSVHVIPTFFQLFGPQVNSKLGQLTLYIHTAPE